MRDQNGRLIGRPTARPASDARVYGKRAAFITARRSSSQTALDVMESGKTSACLDAIGKIRTGHGNTRHFFSIMLICGFAVGGIAQLFLYPVSRGKKGAREKPSAAPTPDAKTLQPALSRRSRAIRPASRSDRCRLCVRYEGVSAVAPRLLCGIAYCPLPGLDWYEICVFFL